MENKYIIPTKENPVFRVINTYEGYIVNDCPLYKGWQVKNEQSWVCGETSATSLPGAMEALFKHIQNNPDKEAAKYTIEMIDGTVDKWGEPVYQIVYKISMKQAKKFKII
jgi:hypothetical protein